MARYIIIIERKNLTRRFYNVAEPYISDNLGITFFRGYVMVTKR